MKPPDPFLAQIPGAQPEGPATVKELRTEFQPRTARGPSQLEDGPPDPLDDPFERQQLLRARAAQGAYVQALRDAASYRDAQP